MDHKIQGWSYTTRREIGRLKRAALRTEQSLLAQEDERLHQEFAAHEAAKRQVEFTDDLRFIHELSIFGLERYANNCPSPIDQIDGRTAWEVYLGAVRGFLAEFPQGYVSSALFSLLGLEGVRQKLLSYAQEWESHLPAYYRVMKDVSAYQHIFERAEQDMCAHKKPDYQLLRSYAMYKTWLHDDSFENFSRAYSETCASAVTLIIEGPIQLYLMIANDHMQIILKSLTVKRISDLFSSNGIADMMHLGKYVAGGVQKSRLIPIGISFAKTLSHEYLKDWKDDMSELRSQYTSVEKRNRFIHAFEQGAFFSS